MSSVPAGDSRGLLGRTHLTRAMVDSAIDKLLNPVAPHPDALTVGLAARGDGAAVSTLLPLALGERAFEADPLYFSRTVDKVGGRIRVPYGHALVFVGRRRGSVVGAAHVAPLVRWLDGHPRALRGALAPLMMEIDALAVRPDCRGAGVGSALLLAAEQATKAQGGSLVLAKVLMADRPVMLWYKRRGYTLVGRGEPVVLKTRGVMDSLDSASNEYGLAVKAVRPGHTVRRRHDDELGTYLMLERA